MTVLPLVIAFSFKVYALYFILFILALGFLGAFAVLGYSVWKQRTYNKAELPALYSEDAAAVDEEVSAFALDVLDEEPNMKRAYTDRIDDEYAFQMIEQKPVEYEPEEFTLPSLEELENSALPAEDYSEEVFPVVSSSADSTDDVSVRYFEDEDDDDMVDQLAQEFTDEVAEQNRNGLSPSFVLRIAEEEELPSLGTIDDVEAVSEDIESISYVGKRARPVPTDSPSPNEMRN